MDVREQAFVHAYIQNKGNAKQAALDSGYAESTANNATYWIDETRTNKDDKRLPPYKPYLREAIDKELKAIEDSKLADDIEILKYLTSVMRKEAKSYIVVVVGIGEGKSEARLIEKHPDEKESLKAAEIIARIHGMFNKAIKVDISPIVLEGYEDVAD